MAVLDLDKMFRIVDCELQEAREKIKVAVDELKTLRANVEAERRRVEEHQLQVEEQQQYVEQRAAEVEREFARLEEEKAFMTKAGIGNNDLIGLNFGGEQVMTVKRSLLLQIEDSMLARLFSGRWEDNFDRDRDGNVFLDYAPEVMKPLINYLRLLRDTAPDQSVALPRVEPPHEKAWNGMLNYFQLLHHPSAMTFSGVQSEVGIGTLKGWTMFHSQVSASALSLRFLLPTDALQGSALLIGMRQPGSDVIGRAAMGDRSIITHKLLSAASVDRRATFEHNGVQWHYTGDSLDVWSTLAFEESLPLAFLGVRDIVVFVGDAAVPTELHR